MATYTIITLGCRANQADSELIEELLLKAGLRRGEVNQAADIGIVNSCTVTQEADRKTGQMLRRLLAKCKVVVLTGCGAARKGGMAGRVPEGVVVVPPQEREDILKYLGLSINLTNLPKTKSLFGRHRTRALLKVQEGCNHMCTFCIVPLVRGPLRSWQIEELLPKVNKLVDEGYREIVFTGTHLALWGRREGKDLADLIEGLIENTSGVRFRISSIEPMSFPRRIFALMRSHPDRLCPHLHLVIQHASDKILRSMHRDYTLAEYESLATEFIKTVPGAVLTTDVLLGFPGETEEDIAILEDYLRRRPFYHLHIFPYSKRQGTVAASLPDQVEESVKKERVHRLMSLGEELAQGVYDSFKGQRRPILIERKSQKPGFMLGTADNFLSVEVPGDESLIGQIVMEEIR